MAPRVTLLIIVGILIYVSLSLYHWNQVEKMPNPEKQSGVHSVLTRDNHEKNWVQISTSPGLSGENAKNIIPIIPPVAKVLQAEELMATPSVDSQAETSISPEDETSGPVQEKQQIFHDENNALRKALQNEKEINLRQAQKIEELQTQTISLQSALDAAPAGLQKENNVQEERNKQSDTLNTKSDEIVFSQDNRIKTLKTLLASRLDALAKANDRITALADRLEQKQTHTY